MRKLLLIPAIFSLALSVACGGSGSSNNGDGGFGSGGSNGYSAASLSGQYAYQVSGFDFNTGANLPFKESGVFTADGKGNITSGTDDFAEGTSTFSDPTTGTYTVSSDGTGSINLGFSSGSSITLALTIASSSKVLLTVPVINGVAESTGSGIALKQDTTTLSTVPSGYFAFASHTVSTTLGSAATAGAFSITTGTIAGDEDVLQAGALAPHTLTGLFNTPDVSGRGTVTFTNELSSTATMNYYIVDANTMLLFSTVAGVNGIGRAEKQSANTFAVSSLSGNYAFGSKGDTGSLDAVNSAGRFTAGGDGTITAGVFDSVQDGTPVSNIGFTGTYTMAANGRAVLNLTPATGSAIEQVAYVVSPTRAFFLVNDAAKVEDGTMDGQSASFSNSSLNGNYAFATDGFNTTDSFNRLGTLNGDGAGNLKLDYVLTEPTLTSQTVSLTGTYTVASNGRAVGNVANLSSNFVMYLISGTDGYIVQADSGTQMAGSFSKQQ
ncbi:MAG TPA: hypothetical protein VH088_17315 [Terriglobales bacterium]|jgi:hypothetical protein|nr:hypothetical protein [Terriglobales bacterium]